MPKKKKKKEGSVMNMIKIFDEDKIRSCSTLPHSNSGPSPNKALFKKQTASPLVHSLFIFENTALNYYFS